MGEPKKLFTYTEIDDRTPIQKLSFSEQMRVLLRKITHSKRNELATEDAVTHEYLVMRANLLDFFSKATKTIREGKHKSVTMSVSNRFDPVLDEVINSPQIKNFYTVQVTRPEVDYDIQFFLKVRLEVKAY